MYIVSLDTMKEIRGAESGCGAAVLTLPSEVTEQRASSRTLRKETAGDNDHKRLLLYIIISPY